MSPGVPGGMGAEQFDRHTTVLFIEGIFLHHTVNYQTLLIGLISRVNATLY